jgi:hypothetical protein
MKRKTNMLASGRRMRQEVPQVRPEVRGVRATTGGSFTTEEIVLNTARRSINVRTPAVPGGGTVMGTSQFGRGHKPCTGTESQSTEWQ